MGHDEKLFATKHLIIRDKLEIGDAVVTANASAVINLITDVGPAAITVSTPSKWLNISQGGTIYFVPMWT